MFSFGTQCKMCYLFLLIIAEADLSCYSFLFESFWLSHELAAARGSKIKLTDIQEVPIPADPVTGNPFIYAYKEGKSARLEAPVSPGNNHNNHKRPVFILTCHNQ